MAKKLSRMAQMAKDLLNYKAMDILTLKMSHAALKTLGKDKFTASGVIVSITNLSGDILMPPTMITDGLSPATIDALRADIQATYDMRLAYSKI